MPDTGLVPARDVALTDRHRWVTLLGEVSQLAHAIAGTSFVPAALRGDEPAIVAAVLYGDEVGLPPMAALSKVAVIDGKPSLAAEAQRALILSQGHELWVEDSTVTRVTVAGRRRGSQQIQRVTWTIDDAKRANLAGKSNWRSYPRAMLLARASAELARAAFADCIGGLPASEELEDVTPSGDGAEPEPQPEAATRRRRRRTIPAHSEAKPPMRDTPVLAAPAVEPDEPPPPPLPDESTASEPSAPAPVPPAPTPAPPPAPEPPRIRPAQSRALHAGFRNLGISDRTERLAWTNARLDRVVASSSELTPEEADMLLEAQAAQGTPEDAEPANSDPSP